MPKYATEAERKQARYESQKRWREKNKERYNAYTREYLQRKRADPEKRKEMNLLKRMWRKVRGDPSYLASPGTVDVLPDEPLVLVRTD